VTAASMDMFLSRSRVGPGQACPGGSRGDLRRRRDAGTAGGAAPMPTVAEVGA
jgi:hypothetical protein